MVYRTTIPCETANLQEVRQFIAQVLKDCYQVPELEADKIVLAADEVCTNRIIHSNGNNPQALLAVSICVDRQNQEVMVEIKDKGIAFDLNSHQGPDCIHSIIEQRLCGGMGIMLVRRIMDNVQVDKDGEDHVCRLFKRVKNWIG